MSEAGLLLRQNTSEIIGKWVSLKPKNDYYLGLCPFHKDTNPSFNCSNKYNNWRCWACGASGDTIEFVARITGRPREEVISELHGIRERQIYGNVAQDKFSSDIWFKKEAIDYLRSRKLEDSTIYKWGFGYDDGSYSFNKNDMPFIFNGDWRFTLNRITIPFYRGKNVIGFTARSITGDKRKYVHSKNSSSLEKGWYLFGENQIHSSENHICVFEGPLDVISAWQAGVRNGVACLGANITHGQKSILRKHKKEIVLVMDSDVPGEIAALKTIDLFCKTDGMLDLKIATICDAKDASQYFETHTKEDWDHHVWGKRLCPLEYVAQIIENGEHNYGEKNKMLTSIVSHIVNETNIGTKISHISFLNRLKKYGIHAAF